MGGYPPHQASRLYMTARGPISPRCLVRGFDSRFPQHGNCWARQPSIPHQRFEAMISWKVRGSGGSAEPWQQPPNPHILRGPLHPRPSPPPDDAAQVNASCQAIRPPFYSFPGLKAASPRNFDNKPLSLTLGMACRGCLPGLGLGVKGWARTCLPGLAGSVSRDGPERPLSLSLNHQQPL